MKCGTRLLKCAASAVCTVKWTLSENKSERDNLEFDRYVDISSIVKVPAMWFRPGVLHLDCQTGGQVKAWREDIEQPRDGLNRSARYITEAGSGATEKLEDTELVGHPG